MIDKLLSSFYCLFFKKECPNTETTETKKY